MLTVADTYNSDIHPMYIKIVYTLNDGKQVKRAYYGVNQDIYNMLLDLDKSDYRTARLYDAFFGKYKTEDQYSKDDIKAYKNAVEKRDLEYISQYNFNTYKRALQDDSSTITFYNKSAFGTELEISSEERKNFWLIFTMIYQPCLLQSSIILPRHTARWLLPQHRIPLKHRILICQANIIQAALPMPPE